MSDTPTETEATDPTRTDRDTLDTNKMKWVSAIIALIGLYIAASPFILEATEAALWNDVLVGMAIFLVAAYNFYRMTSDQLAVVGAASLVLLLGLWAAISPAFIEMGSTELATGTSLSGAAVAVLAAYNAYANRKADTPEHAGTRA